MTLDANKATLAKCLSDGRWRTVYDFRMATKIKEREISRLLRSMKKAGLVVCEEVGQDNVPTYRKAGK